MIELIRLSDIIEIKYLLLKDDLYLGILGPSQSKDFDLNFLSTRVVYKAIDEDKIVGLFIIKEFINNCLCFHGGVFKEFRGSKTGDYIRQCVDLVKKEFNCEIIAPILKTNEAAIKAIKKANFIEKTELKNAAKEGDVLIFGEK